MASKEKEANGNINPTVKSAKEIAAEFAKTVNELVGVEDRVADLRRMLSTQAETVAASEEERRRKTEKEDYDRAQERQAQIDNQTRADADRKAGFDDREADIDEAEGELCELLGLVLGEETKISRKMIRDAYAKRIAETDKAAEGRGRGIAEKAAVESAKLTQAQAETASALLIQENKLLKERNSTLERQNAELLANQQKTTDVIASVANGAFQAAGGVVKQGNEALGSVAGQQFGGRPPR